MNATLFVGYRPSFDGEPNWRRTFQQSRQGLTGSIVRRTSWLDQTDNQHRVIIEVGEYRNDEDVKSALAVAMREANIDFKRGPASLGDSARTHPDPRSSSIYVTRANLLIWATSHGVKRFDVEPVLKRIVGELDAVPARDQDLDEDLRIWEPEGGASNAVALAFESRWARGESAWLKFITDADRLELSPEHDRLLVWPRGRRLTVTGWVIEPGRKPYIGRFTSTGGPTP